MINPSAIARHKSVTADILLYMKNKDIINSIISCAEYIGWHVNTYNYPTNDKVMFEFSKFTPAGHDFSFNATMQGSSLCSLTKDMEDYYEGFDPDDETYLWLDESGHGRNGAPYRMKDVLEDMEAAYNMVSDLLKELQNLADKYV